MTKQSITYNLDDFPVKLHPYLKDSKLYDYSSHSSAKVLYSDKGYFLKMDAEGQLAEEAQLARWFESNKLGVPVLEYLNQDGKDYFLTQKADGVTALELMSSEDTVITFAKALKRLHQSKPADFPVPNRLDRYRQLAEQNYQEGTFYKAALLPQFNINTREEAYHLISTKGQLLKADSFIHGDSCLPNLILKDSQTFSAFIDIGLSGLNDKHIDIFGVIWSLNYNRLENYTDLFLDSYGRDEINFEKLQIVAAYEAFS